jgi:hypothetical protein
MVLYQGFERERKAKNSERKLLLFIVLVVLVGSCFDYYVLNPVLAIYNQNGRLVHVTNHYGDSLSPSSPEAQKILASGKYKPVTLDY